MDVLFHHKFSIPLVTSCPAVVQQRGTEYWSHPEFYSGLSGRLDQLYNRLMIPSIAAKRCGYSTIRTPGFSVRVFRASA